MMIMRRWALVFLIGPFLFGFSWIREPQKLLHQAETEIALAQRAEKEDYSKALIHYQLALEALENLISKYPSSNLATEVVNGSRPVGPCNYPDLKLKIIPRIERNAKAEKDFLAFALVMEDQVKGDPSGDKAIRLSTIALLYAQRGDFNKSMQLFAQTLNEINAIGASQQKNKAIRKVAADYNKSGIKDDSLEKSIQTLVQSIEKDLHKGDEQEALIEASGRPVCKKENFDPLLARTEATEDIYPRSAAIIYLAQTCYKEGEKERADQLIIKAFALLEKGQRSVIEVEKGMKLDEELRQLGEISKNLSNAKDQNKIKSLLKNGLINAVPGARKIDDICRRNGTLEGICIRLASIGYPQEALEIANRMETTACNQCDDYKYVALGAIATNYAIMKDFNRAIEITKMIKGECEITDNTLYEIIKEYIESGGKDERIIKEIADIHQKNGYHNIDDKYNGTQGMLVRIAEVYGNKGMLSDALRVIDLMDDERAIFDAQIKLVIACFHNKDEKTAFELFDKSVELAQKLQIELSSEGCKSNRLLEAHEDSIMGNIACSFKKAGNQEMWDRIVHKNLVKNTDLNDCETFRLMYSSIRWGCNDYNAFNEAYHIAQTINDQEERSNDFRKLVETLSSGDCIYCRVPNELFIDYYNIKLPSINDVKNDGVPNRRFLIKSHFLQEVSGKYSKNGGNDVAFYIRMLDDAQELTEYEEGPNTFNSIISGFLGAKCQDPDFISRSLQMVNGLSDPLKRYTILSSLACKMIEIPLDEKIKVSLHQILNSLG